MPTFFLLNVYRTVNKYPRLRQFGKGIPPPAENGPIFKRRHACAPSTIIRPFHAHNKMTKGTAQTLVHLASNISRYTVDAATISCFKDEE
jgi:hypothetical protein